MWAVENCGCKYGHSCGVSQAVTYRLGPLEGHAESSVPDELSGDTERSRDTEQDGVEVLLVEAVALGVVSHLPLRVDGDDLLGEEDTGVGVHVGPGVLGLAGLEEDVGHDLVDLADELEEGVLRQVLEGKLSLGGVSGVLQSSASGPIRRSRNVQSFGGRRGRNRGRPGPT